MQTINQLLMIVTLMLIWLSLFISFVMLSGAIHFWFKNSHRIIETPALSRYPLITVVVPAYNEEIVIENTTRALLALNYPKDKVELLLYSDNSTDHTADRMRQAFADEQHAGRNYKIIERTGTGGKAGVLNDSLKIARGEFIAVYDADAMPEKNALYFLVQKALENPDRYMAVFGRNKTRNADQNYLTRFINQEIMVSQRIQHIAMWHMFKIGRIPGTNFIIQRDFVDSIGGWSDGALTEDTDISFKIMQSGKLIALAYNSEAFQQEPEHLKDYYFQRLRWAKGNYQVVLDNFKNLFNKSNWRVKFETFYFTSTFFIFNSAVILSDIIFLVNFGFMIWSWFDPNTQMPFTFTQGNTQISQVLVFNWLLMILLYMLQISIALASQFGQTTAKSVRIALASYFTYSQLFIIVSVHAVLQVLMDKIFKRNGTRWVKTKRFED